MKSIMEPVKQVPIVGEADVCILGGSCTGVFAAIRAARLGAKVIIVEKQNSFGGAATSGLVNIWHSIYDVHFKEQIIAGLSVEVLDRLKMRDELVIVNREMNMFIFNSEELKIELDTLILEQKNITPMLHTMYAAPYIENSQLKGVFVENKSGRGVILAKTFIDATGDGDLCKDVGVEQYSYENILPPTACSKLYRDIKIDGAELSRIIEQHGAEFGLEDDWGWNALIPGMENIRMHAETHIFNVNLKDSVQLTRAEMNGRQQIRAIVDTARKYMGNGGITRIVDLCSYIGIRETNHSKNLYKMKEDDLLTGKKFENAIANCTYPVDIHHAVGGGVTLKHLDGKQIDIDRKNGVTEGRWRSESEPTPLYWQVPYESLLNEKYKNLFSAGRMIDAEHGAFAAIRVMICLNQIGEAAGVAAYLALDNKNNGHTIDTKKLHNTLVKGGSIIL